MGGWRAVTTEMEMAEMGNKGFGMLISGAFGAAVIAMGFGVFAEFKEGAEAIVEFQSTKNEQMESLLEDVMNGSTTSDDFQMVQEELDRQYEELLGQVDNGG